MRQPMMKCGHRANGVLRGRGGVDLPEPIPACVICTCYEIDDKAPDLTGRSAKCGAKCAVRPSTDDLAFFEYQGPGSYTAALCKCGYAWTAHDPEAMKKNVPSNRRTVVEQGKCRGYEPRAEGLPHDKYYCGCHGWD